jgi:general stress protein 26
MEGKQIKVYHINYNKDPSSYVKIKGRLSLIQKEKETSFIWLEKAEAVKFIK